MPPCWTPSRGGAPPSSTSASTPPTPCDFLDTVGPVCAAVTEGRTDRDLLFSGTGVGACIAANKLPVVRAARCHDAHSAHRSVEHDDADVFCFGAHIVCPGLLLSSSGSASSPRRSRSGHDWRRWRSWSGA